MLRISIRSSGTYWLGAWAILGCIGLLVSACSRQDTPATVVRPKPITIPATPNADTQSQIAAITSPIATPDHETVPSSDSAASLVIAISPIPALQLQTPVAESTMDAVNQRPIPTLDAANPTPVMRSGNTPRTIIEATIVYGQGLLEGQPNLVEADRLTLERELGKTRDSLRNLVYVINQAEQSGALSCGEVVRYYALVDGSPSYRTTPESMILYTFYRDAVDQTRATISDLNTVCESLINEAGLRNADLDITAPEVATTYQGAAAGGRSALTSMYSAIGWLNISPETMKQIFTSTRGDIYTYGSIVNSGTSEDCAAMTQMYEQIVSESPRFSTPYDYRRQAYNFYISAINSVKGGGRKVENFCNQVTGGLAEAGAIPAEAHRSAMVGRGIALIEVDYALTEIAPTNTPTTVPTRTPRPRVPVATATQRPRPTQTSRPPRVVRSTATPTPRPAWPTETPSPTFVWPTRTPTSAPSTRTPFPTRTPTAVPPTATMVPRQTFPPLTAIDVELRNIESANAGFWILNFDVEVTGGTPPYTTIAGDFSAPGTQITILYKCGAAFVEKFVVVDATGASISSTPIFVSSKDVCD